MSSSSTSPTPATPAKRACDSCHRRKVKCLPIGDDPKPCRNCVAAGLDCTFYNKVQKKGPKGSRAKVLSEIRETQKLIYPRPTYDQSAVGAAIASQGEKRPISPSNFDRTPGLLSGALLDACVDYFFKNMYRAQPILHPAGVMQTVQNMVQSTEAYCTMTALCAYVLLQPQSLLPSQLQSTDEYQQHSSKVLGRALVDESIRCRRAHDVMENPTLLSIYTSYFLSRCLHCLDRQDSAWIHLRQAVTVAHVLGLPSEETYGSGDVVSNFTTRKLFWTLFITERVYAIKMHRPLSLHSTIQLPNPKEEPEGPHLIFGFVQLIKLYNLLDDRFFSLWNRSGKDFSAHWLEQMQGVLTAASAANLDIGNAMDIDFKVSRNWLRALVWQLLLMQEEAAQVGTDRAIAYKQLVEICHEVVQNCSAVSQLALEMHGLDMAEKICDIASIMSDSISFLPYNHSLTARDILHRLITILLSLSSSYGRVASSIHTKAIRHFSQSGSNIGSPASSTPSQFNQDDMSLVGQGDVLGMPQIPVAYTMSVQGGIAAPSNQMENPQYAGMLGDVSSAEYMGFGSHQSSAGPSQQPGPGYPPYRYME